MTPAQPATEPTSIDGGTKRSAQDADTSNPAVSPRCQTCGAQPGNRVAFLRGGPADKRLWAVPSFPIRLRVPVMPELSYYLSEDSEVPLPKVAVYERTEITFRGVLIYIYRREED